MVMELFKIAGLSEATCHLIGLVRMAQRDIFFRCRKRPFGVVETATVLLAKTHQWPFVGLLQIDRKVTNMDHNAHWVDMHELAEDLEKVEPRHALCSLCTSVRPDDLFTRPSQS